MGIEVGIEKGAEEAYHLLPILRTHVAEKAAKFGITSAGATGQLNNGIRKALAMEIGDAVMLEHGASSVGRPSEAILRSMYEKDLGLSGEALAEATSPGHIESHSSELRGIAYRHLDTIKAPSTAMTDVGAERGVEAAKQLGK